MPELPEVETVRRQLEPAVVGRTILRAEVLDERWSRPISVSATERRLNGRRIEAAERRGKYLLLRLDGGRSLVMHLRMTGNLLLRDGDFGLRHLRARLALDDGGELWFSDVRRFGTGIVLGDEELDEYFASRVGIEPLSEALTAGAIERLASGRSAPLKSFLLNQSGIAGIGNIYANEALHRAALHPLSPAGSIRPQHAEALRVAIVEALELGLANGGSSIDDYVDTSGQRGRMQEEFLVHGREGQGCDRCGEMIRRIVIAGRSSYFCGGCQQRLRRRPWRRGAAARRVAGGAR